MLDAPRSALGPRDAYIRRERFIITDLADAWLDPAEKLTSIDGGARDAAADLRWRGYPRHRRKVYGFDLDPAECAETERALAADGIEARIFPTGLWSKRGSVTLHELAEPSASSVYPPAPLMRRWKMQSATNAIPVGPLVEVTGKRVIEVDALDNLGLGPVDFLKLNVQGAELEILNGAQSLLPTLLGAEVEVAFVESYTSRPMFSDVDPAMRRHGLNFFELVGHHCVGRVASPITARHMPGLYGLNGQMIEAHAVYLRDPAPWMTPVDVLKLASIAEVYHQVEFALEVLISTRHPLADRAVGAYREIMG